MPQIHPVTLDGKVFKFAPKYKMSEAKEIRGDLIALGKEVAEWGDKGEEKVPSRELEAAWTEVAKKIFGEVEVPTLNDLGEEGLWDVTMGFSGRYFPQTK